MSRKRLYMAPTTSSSNGDREGITNPQTQSEYAFATTTGLTSPTISVALIPVEILSDGVTSNQGPGGLINNARCCLMPVSSSDSLYRRKPPAIVTVTHPEIFPNPFASMAIVNATTASLIAQLAHSVSAGILSLAQFTVCSVNNDGLSAITEVNQMLSDISSLIRTLCESLPLLFELSFHHHQNQQREGECLVALQSDNSSKFEASANHMQVAPLDFSMEVNRQVKTMRQIKPRSNFDRQSRSSSACPPARPFLVCDTDALPLQQKTNITLPNLASTSNIAELIEQIKLAKPTDSSQSTPRADILMSQVRRTVGQDGTALFACPVESCQQTYPRLDRVRIHLYKHTEERPFVCPVCSAGFRCKFELKRHRLNVNCCSRSSPIKTIISAQLSIPSGLSRRRRVRALRLSSTAVHGFNADAEEVLFCPVINCSRSFARKSALLEHLYVHTGERPYICGRCLATFVRQCDLSKHLFVHTSKNRRAMKPKAAKTVSLS